MNYLNFASLTNLFGNNTTSSSLLSTFGSYILNGSLGSTSIFGGSGLFGGYSTIGTTQNTGIYNGNGYNLNYNAAGQARSQQSTAVIMGILSMIMPSAATMLNNFISGIVNDKLNEQLNQTGSGNRSSVADAKQKEALKKEQLGYENKIAENNSKLNILNSSNLKDIVKGTQYNNVGIKDTSSLNGLNINTNTPAISTDKFKDIAQYLNSDADSFLQGTTLGKAFSTTDASKLTDFSNLKAELERVTGRCDELKQFKTALNGLSIDESKVEQHKDFAKINNDLEIANNNVTEGTVSFDSKTTELTNHQAKIDQKEEEKTANLKQISETTQLIGINDGQIKTLTDLIAHIQSQIDSLDYSKNNNYREKLDELEYEKSLYKGQKDDLIKDNEKLKTKEEELKKKEKELQGEINQLNIKKVEIQGEKDIAQQNLAGYKVKQSELEQKKEELKQTTIQKLQSSLNEIKNSYEQEISKQGETLKAYADKLNALVMSVPPELKEKLGNGEITFSQLLEKQEKETTDAKNVLGDALIENDEIDDKLQALRNNLNNDNNKNYDKLKLLDFMNEKFKDLDNGSDISRKQARQLRQKAVELYNSPDGTYQKLVDYAAGLGIDLSQDKGTDTNNNDIADNWQNTATNGVDKETFINQMRSEYGNVRKWVNDNVSGDKVTSSDAQKMKQEAGKELSSYKDELKSSQPKFGDLENFGSIIEAHAAKDIFKKHVSSSEDSAIRSALQQQLLKEQK